MSKCLVSFAFFCIYAFVFLWFVLLMTDILPKDIGDVVPMVIAITVLSAVVHSFYLLGLGKILSRDTTRVADHRDPSQNFRRVRSKAHFKRLQCIKQTHEASLTRDRGAKA